MGLELSMCLELPRRGLRETRELRLFFEGEGRFGRRTGLDLYPPSSYRLNGPRRTRIPRYQPFQCAGLEERTRLKEVQEGRKEGCGPCVVGVNLTVFIWPNLVPLFCTKFGRLGDVSDRVGVP